MSESPTLRLDVQRDWNWSDGFLPDIQKILIQNAFYVFEVKGASAQQDLKQATDLLLTVSGKKSVAVRIRRDNCRYRDLTIRARRTSGAKTELEKIKEGNGDLYLYGWALGTNSVREWMLVDLHKLRASGLLEHNWSLKKNTDNTTQFIAIPYSPLSECGCILAANVRTNS